VGSLLDVRARRRALEHGPHLVGDAGAACDQHLECRGIEAHADLRKIHAPSGPTSARHPGATYTVQSGSLTTAGPRTVSRSGGSKAVIASGAGLVARARSATTSIAVSGFA